MGERQTAANIKTVIAVTLQVMEAPGPFRAAELDVEDVPKRTVRNALERLEEEGYLQHEEQSPYWQPTAEFIAMLPGADSE